MPEAFAAQLADPGLYALAAAAFVAGAVYGFAGFGSALIFVPLASALAPPSQAVLAMALFGLSSIFTVLPRAWVRADRAEVLPMLAVALVMLGFGSWLLKVVPEAPLRWAVSGAVALTLAALVAGWRYRGRPGRAVSLSAGAASGLLGGATGLVGPPVLLFYLSGPGRAERTRANTIVFLTLLASALLPSLALQGLVTEESLARALLLVPVYMVATSLGQRLFDPAREGLYRRTAYLIVAGAVVAGLPVWD